MAYQVISKSNNTCWLMTSNGNWVSSHHSIDEAIAACRAWFKCSPIVRKIQEQPIDKLGSLKKKITHYLIKTIPILTYASKGHSANRHE